MKTVNVANTSDSFISQLVALQRTFSNIEDAEDVQFDLSRLGWACPLLALPMAAHIRTFNSSAANASGSTKSYLDAIGFPNGVDSAQALQESKSYIPVTVIEQAAGATQGREAIESAFQQKILTVVGPSASGGKDALYYPLSELATNITEHSKTDHGYLLAQYYPRKEFLDVCIVDCGRGVAATYRDELNRQLSDSEAIREAMKGVSTKPSQERGYGLRTSKNVVCDVLGGEFLLISGGEALYFKADQESKAITLPNFNWQGTIVAYRIAKPKTPVNIYDHLE